MSNSERKDPAGGKMGDSKHAHSSTAGESLKSPESRKMVLSCALMIVIAALSIYLIYPFRAYDDQQLQECYQHTNRAVVLSSTLMESYDRLIQLFLDNSPEFQTQSRLMDIYMQTQRFGDKAHMDIADVDSFANAAEQHRKGIKPPIDVALMRQIIVDSTKNLDAMQHVAHRLRETAWPLSDNDGEKDRIIAMGGLYRQYLEELGRFLYLETCEMYAPLGGVPEACNELFLRTGFARYIPLSEAAKPLAPDRYEYTNSPAYTPAEAIGDISLAKASCMEALQRIVQELIEKSIEREDQIDGVFLML